MIKILIFNQAEWRGMAYGIVANFIWWNKSFSLCTNKNKLCIHVNLMQVPPKLYSWLLLRKSIYLDVILNVCPNTHFIVVEDAKDYMEWLCFGY